MQRHMAGFRAFAPGAGLVLLLVSVVYRLSRNRRRTRIRHAKQPKCFCVPKNDGAILDLSLDAATPERQLKDHLLSLIGPNVVVAEGMGGAGKSTIARGLGHDKDVWSKYSDGVWFMQLGQEATIDKFWSEVQLLVDEACPHFSERLEKLLSRSTDPRSIVQQLVKALGGQRLLIILDDVWVHSAVASTVLDLAAQLSRQGSFTKTLISTREAAVADKLSSVVVKVDPRSCKGAIAKRILCSYAGIAVSSMDTVPPNVDRAFDQVLGRCDGLPLALCVAGSAVKRLIMSDTADDTDGNVEGAKWSSWVEFSRSLNENLKSFGERGGNVDHVDGVFACIKTSLRILNESWPLFDGRSKEIGLLSADAVLRSLSIIAKQDCMPLEAFQLAWAVDVQQAKEIVRLFWESSLVTRVIQGDSLGVKVHDLVVDYATLLVREQGEVGHWDECLVAGYARSLQNVKRHSGDLPYLRPWWCMKVSSCKYLTDNLVRHMLRCGLENEAIALLCDYRWIEFVNDDEERLPFHKLFADLKLLQCHLRSTYINESVRESSAECLEVLCAGVELMIEGAQMCMFTCARNREECSFQLFGCLRELTQRFAVVGRCVWTMEAHARRPWVRPGPGLVSSGGRNLKRRLPVGYDVNCIEPGLDDDELLFGGLDGFVNVIDVHSGRTLRSLCGHSDWITGISVHRSVGEVITCSEDGKVIVWHGEVRIHTFQPFEEEDNSLVACMGVMEEPGLIACGSGEGLIRIISKRTGGVVRDLVGHTKKITSILAVSDGKLLISGSNDGTIRKWDVNKGGEAVRVLVGHEDEVACVAVSTDKQLIASGSRDKTVRLWDVHSGTEICKPVTGHRNKVLSVAFSGDMKLLYSCSWDGVFVWDVSSAQDGVQMKNKLIHDNIMYFRSLCVSSDNTELFALSALMNEVFVWRAHPRQTVNDEGASGRLKRSFLKGIDAVGVSPDGSTMVTADWSSLNMRRVHDVSNAVDDVLTECDVRNLHPKECVYVRRVAVTNDKRIVAFAHNSSDSDLNVYIVRIRTGNVLHELSDLKDWLSSLRADYAYEELEDAHVSALSFSPDGSSITAVARVRGEYAYRWLSKSITWTVSTGELCATECLPTACGGEPQPTHDVRSSDRDLPHLEIKSGDDYYLSDEVSLLSATDTITAGTLNFIPDDAAYDANTGRLWIAKRRRDICFVDLICDGTMTKSDVDPPPSLPLLPKKDPPRTTGNHQAPRYQVFISHAGTEKLAFALPLHGALEELEIEAFLDMVNLRPGNDAPAEMVDAMNSAPIAIFIISAQFAARPWTVKELMCFIERDRVAMEKGLPRPVIIPVFLHLTVAQCKDPALLLIRDENGDSVFEKEGFFEREKYGRASCEDVTESMKRLALFTGIENKEGANSRIVDGEPVEEGEKRKVVVAKMVDAIVEAMANNGIQRKGGAWVQAGPGRPTG